MAPQQVQWGSITLHLDNEAFRKGFLDARRWYFLDIYGEKGRAPEEPERANTLHSEDVLRLIAVPDEQGRYHLGAEAHEDIAEYLGYLIGDVSGPLVQNTKLNLCLEPFCKRHKSGHRLKGGTGGR